MGPEGDGGELDETLKVERLSTAEGAVLGRLRERHEEIESLRQELARLQAPGAGLPALRHLVEEAARLQASLGLPASLLTKDVLLQAGVPVEALEQARGVLLKITACDAAAEHARAQLVEVQGSASGPALLEDLEKLLVAWGDLRQLAMQLQQQRPASPLCSVDLGLETRRGTLGMLCEALLDKARDLKPSPLQGGMGDALLGQDRDAAERFQERLRGLCGQDWARQAFDSLGVEAPQLGAQLPAVGETRRPSQISIPRTHAGARSCSPTPPLGAASPGASPVSPPRPMAPGTGALNAPTSGAATPPGARSASPQGGGAGAAAAAAGRASASVPAPPGVGAGAGAEECLGAGGLASFVESQRQELEHRRGSSRSASRGAEQRRETPPRGTGDSPSQAGLMTFSSMGAAAREMPAMPPPPSTEHFDIYTSRGTGPRASSPSVEEEAELSFDAVARHVSAAERAVAAAAGGPPLPAAAPPPALSVLDSAAGLPPPDAAPLPPFPAHDAGQRGPAAAAPGPAREEPPREAPAGRATRGGPPELWRAVHVGDEAAVSALIQVGACDGLMRDASGHSALWHAIAFGHMGLAKLLVDTFPPGTEAGVDVTEVHPRRGDTLLHLLCQTRPFSAESAGLFKRVASAAPRAILEKANAGGNSFLEFAAASLNFWVLKFACLTLPVATKTLVCDERKAPLRLVAEAAPPPLAPAGFTPPDRVPEHFALAALLSQDASGRVPFADVAFDVGPEDGSHASARFMAHRVVAAAHSPVLLEELDRMPLQRLSQESASAAIFRVDPRIGKDVWRAVLQFMYTGAVNCPFSKDAGRMVELLRACALYKLPKPLLDFAQSAVFQLLPGLSPGAALQVFSLSAGASGEGLELRPAREAAVQVLLRTAPQVFQAMEATEVAKILERVFQTVEYAAFHPPPGGQPQQQRQQAAAGQPPAGHRAAAAAAPQAPQHYPGAPGAGYPQGHPGAGHGEQAAVASMYVGGGGRAWA